MPPLVLPMIATGVSGTAELQPVTLPRQALLAARRHAEIPLIAGGLLVLLIFFVHRAWGWNDVILYRSYASWFWGGPHPFRSLPLEYPPASILVFTLALVPAIRDSATVFAFWMGAAFWLGYFAFLRYRGRASAALFAAYLLLGGAATLLNRYDILPALTVVAAIWAATRSRWRLAYVLLAAGVLLKLYPLFLVPLFVIAHREELASRDWKRKVFRSAWPPAAMVAGGFAAAGAIDFAGTLSPFVYASARPLQLESVPGSVLWLLSFFGFPALSDRGFRSFNLVGPLGPGVGSVFSVLMIVGMAFVYWRYAGGRLSLARACLAVVCVSIFTNKVFSPQYLIWVLPLVALVDDRIDALWLAVAGLTTLIYPLLYLADGVLGTPGPFPYGGDLLFTVAVRNVLFGVATVRAMLPERARVSLREAPAVSAAGD